MMSLLLFALSSLSAAWCADVVPHSEAVVPQDSAVYMDDVVVTGTRSVAAPSAIASTVSVVSGEQLHQAERMNMLPALSDYVPGLFATARGVMGYGVSGGAAGGITVRGLQSGSGQVMVLVDGHPQYQGIFSHAIADALLTMQAQRVEVVRGPSSLLYGSNGMGGVVNIITRGAQTDGCRTELGLGYGSYNSFQAEASNSARAGGFSSDVQLLYQRSDNHRQDMGFYQYGGRVRLGYDFSQHWSLGGQFTMSHFAASNPGTEMAPLLEARQWINRGNADITLQNNYDRVSGALSIYHNFGRHKINDGHDARDAARDYLFRSLDALSGISAHQTMHPWSGSWFTVGLDYQRIAGECWNADRVTDERLNRRMEQNMHYPLDTVLHEVAVYADVRQRVASWLMLQAGIRYDHHSAAGSEWVPQGGIIISPMKSAELKLTAGKGFRVPSLREMYLYGAANPDLEPERLWNYELAWQHRLLGGRITYGANVFYLRASDLIAYTMNQGKMMNYNTGSTTHCGAELECTYNINKVWQLHTNHSLLHTEEIVLAAPSYKGFLGATMHLKHWEASLGLQQLCGVTTSIREVAQLATASDSGNSSQKDEAIKENVTLLGATLAYRPVPAVKVWVRGDNLLAQRYQLVDGYPMPRATVMAGVNVEIGNR